MSVRLAAFLVFELLTILCIVSLRTAAIRGDLSHRKHASAGNIKSFFPCISTYILFHIMSRRMQASLKRKLSCSGTLCAQRISMKFCFDIGFKIKENCRANIIMSILNLKFSRPWRFKLWRVSWRHVVREMTTVAGNVTPQSSYK